MALQLLMEALAGFSRPSGGDDNPAVGQLILWSATDIMPHCRKVLRFKHSCSSRQSPLHVFGDLTCRLSTEAHSHLLGLYKDAEQQFMAAMGQGNDPELAEGIGTNFMAACMDYLSTDLLVKINGTAYCFKCRSTCCYNGPEQVPDGMFSIAIAGTTCTSWSRMGRKRRWAAASALPFLAWAYSLLAAVPLPDCIIHECTVDFDHRMLSRIFGAFYEVGSMTFSSEDLGFPASRPRRYSFLRRRQRCIPTTIFDRQHFSILFRSCITSGHVVAPPTTSSRRRSQTWHPRKASHHCSMMGLRGRAVTH